MAQVRGDGSLRGGSRALHRGERVLAAFGGFPDVGEGCALSGLFTRPTRRLMSVCRH